MKNRKGFTLTEVIVVIVLIAAVTLIAVPAYNNIRSRVLENQYKNTVTLIETEALKYASSKGVSITNIQELINEGIIETDDGENLLDPRDKSSLNCRLIEIEYKDGNYSSKLIEAEECDIEKAKLDYSKIAIVKRGKESNKIYIDDTWSNEDLVLSVDVSQLPVGESIKSYRWISGTGQNSNDSTMSTNVTTITDTVVNVEVTTKSNHKYFTMSKIRVDKEKPLIKNVEVNAGNDWKTGRDITIKATDQRGSGISGYYLADAPCDGASTYKEVKKTKEMLKVESIKIYNETNYYVCVKDGAGNYTSYENNPLLLKVTDDIAPTIPEIINPSNGNWTNQNIELTVKSSDGESGLAYYEYTFNPNATSAGTDAKTTWKKSTGSNLTEHKMTFTSENDETVYIRACDNVGNCSEKNSTQIRIDKTKPIVISVNNPSEGVWSRASSVAITITASDEASGIKNHQYTYKSNATTTGTSDETSWVIRADSASNSHVIGFGIEKNRNAYFRVCDNAGNCSDKKSSLIKIDRTAPSAPTITNNKNNVWTNQDISITISSNDTGAGIAKYEWSDDNSTWNLAGATTSTNYTKTITAYHNPIYIRACDNAGNCSSSTSTITLIDKEKPSKPTITNNKNNVWTNQNISINIKSADNRGIARYEWSDDNSNWSLAGTTSSTNYTKTITAYHNPIYIRACDNAGNCSDSTSTKTLIDKTNPVISFTTDGNTTYAKQGSTNVKVTESNLNSIKYTWNKNSTIAESDFGSITTTLSNGGRTSSGCDLGYEGSCYLHIQACDKAGNCAYKSSSAFAVDTKAPSFEQISITDSNCLNAAQKAEGYDKCDKFKVTDRSSKVRVYSSYCIIKNNTTGAATCAHNPSGTQYTAYNRLKYLFDDLATKNYTVAELIANRDANNIAVQYKTLSGDNKTTSVLHSGCASGCFFTMPTSYGTNSKINYAFKIYDSSGNCTDILTYASD